jgi:ferredoxin--NADP+ reductase
VPTFKIAIVGAGPAGYFAAQALQNAQSDDKKFAIDMIERLPTPWGLVRSGVAPDHPKIKTVSKVFEKIATAGNFRLFGNVELGTNVQLVDLQAKYDAVIIATGSSVGRKLGIPGEELSGYLSAADFVPWYNAHPDYTGVSVPLDTDTAIVIGAGNVAMDVARMLALEPSELDATDTADHAIAELKKSNIRKVYICARRGAENAAFTSPELRDLPKLEHTNVIMNKSDIDAAIAAAGDAPEKDVKSNLDAMLAIAEQEKTSHARTMEFLFHHVPTEIKGSGRVQEVVFKTPSGEKVIKSGLVISAIGYEAAPLNGVTYEKGRVLNSDGRVNDNLYVVGWAKRGPSGVIGTNKSDAAAVIDLLIADLKSPKAAGDINDLIGAHKVITQTHWEAINTAEVSLGEPLGKPRVKVADKSELLRLGGL